MKGSNDSEMNFIVTKHLLMNHGIQPSEIDNMPIDEVILFSEFDRQMKEYDRKALARELAKVISKMFGG